MSKFARVAILGLGLIGSSLARVLRTQGLADKIVAAGSRPATLARGVELGIIDQACLSVSEAAAGADLVILAMPVGGMQQAFVELADVLKNTSVIVTDVGSVKGAVVEAAR
ncbi:MAG: prephenate dehydrogenase/arogenate dehydrogenase family protein, partial [Pseudomonadales bacterium]|nr:prephenate dehydrogenase/arogenate dehydrogenase family protein [Pseudomonadales bacterium]